jgi:hypothetical protein
MDLKPTMNLAVANRLFSGWTRWTQATCPRSPYVYFRISFAATWLLYDVLDLALGGTQGFFWGVPSPSVHRGIFVAQLLLIGLETGLLFGLLARWLAFALFLVRLYEASLFPLNDFLYFCVAALLLSQCDCGNGSLTENVPAWPREVFVLQTSWIYFSTALLKLNSYFLSGGDLYVRQNYLASALHWPYPAFYEHWISTLVGNALLAWAGVAAEISMAGLLLAWWFYPAHRRRLHLAVFSLALAIHGFGAIALNVFFFGASMFLQVALFTYVPLRKAPATFSAEK